MGKEFEKLVVHGLVGKPSIAFVKQVFEFYESGQPFVILSNEKAPQLPSRLRLSGILNPESESGWYGETHHPINKDDVAQVSMTSGTTGKPKAIVLSHSNLADTTNRLVIAQGLDDTVREYLGVPPSFSFGLGRVRACSSLGGKIFIPPRGFDPAEIASMLSGGQINSLSAVPTLLRVLLRHRELFSSAGANLRWMEIGSQPMAAQEKAQLLSLFPNAHIVQHYGLTEAARTSFLDISSCSDDALSSVGSPIGHSRLRISSEGRVQIAGPHVAVACITEDGYEPLADSDGWLTTNDNGRIEGGLLYFDGRADDLINIGGIKLQPDRIEDLIRSSGAIQTRIAVCRIADPIRGDGILVATDDQDQSIEQLREKAAETLNLLGVQADGALHVHRFASLPLTDTNKVQRAKLAEQYHGYLESIEKRRGGERGRNRSPKDQNLTLWVFEGAFPRKAITEDQSFADLGGDSLALISISANEELLGGLPEGWETQSIDTLEHGRIAQQGAATIRTGFSQISSEIVLRATAIISIVFHHALNVDLGGGIQILLLLLGVNLARFQRDRLAGRRKWLLLVEMTLKLVLPYYVIILALDFRHDAWVSSPDYLLFSNFVGRENVPTVPYWFILGYIQVLVILLSLASVRRIGRALIERPGLFGLVLLAVAVISKVAALTIFHHQFLRDRTPDQFFT